MTKLAPWHGQVWTSLDLEIISEFNESKPRKAYRYYHQICAFITILLIPLNG